MLGPAQRLCAPTRRDPEAPQLRTGVFRKVRGKPASGPQHHTQPPPPSGSGTGTGSGRHRPSPAAPLQAAPPPPRPARHKAVCCTSPVHSCVRMGGRQKRACFQKSYSGLEGGTRRKEEARPAFVRIRGAKWLGDYRSVQRAARAPNSPDPPDAQAEPGIFPPASPFSPRPGLEGKPARISTPDPRVSRRKREGDKNKQ